ncbi:CHAP domain-containing protein [Streptosporangium sp. NBC_01469]|uniref:CHAP domain-containing protein n=1 Tax=Streptosporangium sp. NBC_01469 TaxID=2903898 RepID=UPI002E2A2294|nr:CHAP domain-containing protein [Streptosporangium sp. NBC_01469]
MHKFVELLESQLGYSEKSGGYTKFGDWYGRNVEFDADYSTAPWCDMYLSWAAEKLGYQEWVGQFAYTVHHAQWFRQQDAWGTVPRPGAIVFFDWSGSNRIDHIDHVGIVTEVEGNRIHTIEGNIDGGIAKRKERDTGKVVGYGYPEKIKARLDREATEKQTIVKPAAAGDNAVVIGPGPGLLAMVPAPAPTQENRASTGPGKGSDRGNKRDRGTDRAEPAPEHAAVTATGKTGKTGKTASGNDGRTASGENAPRGDRVTAGAPVTPRIPASSGRTAPGKHAKASTADTSALAVTPTATVRDLATPVPGFDTPAVLAPVLLAAVAILAHGKARQSRVRLLAPASGRTAAAPSPSSRRTPGRRRAPGRRRMPRNAPALSRAPGNASVSRDLVETPALAHGLGNAPAPYRGRRRLHEQTAVESSTWVRDAPPRGRRHRRADSVITTTIPTIPATPATPATPTRPTRPARPARPAHPVAGPRTAVPVSVPRTGRGDSAVPPGSAALPAEPGDILVHSGYRGRRRAEALV